MIFSSHTELGRFSNEMRTTTVPISDAWISWAEFIPDRSGSLTTSQSHRICTKRSTTIVWVMFWYCACEPNTYIKSNKDHSNAILSEYFGFSDGICCLSSTNCTRTTRRHWSGPSSQEFHGPPRQRAMGQGILEGISGIQGQKCAFGGETSSRSKSPWNYHTTGVQDQ